MKSDYGKSFKSADVMGAVQHHAFSSLQSDGTVLIKILKKNKFLDIVEMWTRKMMR